MPLFHIFYCPGCGLTSPISVLCQWCRKNIRFNSKLLPSPVVGISGIAPLFYSIGSTHRVFKAWKNKRGLLHEKLLFKMNTELASSLRLMHFDCIVPIPQNHKRNWERGHASAESAAAFFSRQLHVPIIRSLKIDPEITAQQSGRQAVDRRFAENPFLLAEPLPTQSRVLIVDDLITTGNTLMRAAEVLSESDTSLIIYAASLGFRPPHQDEVTLGLGNESLEHQSLSSQAQDFYSRFLSKI